MAVESSTGLQLRSLIRNNGELELSLASLPIPEPGPDEVVVRVEASPINPSDLGLLTGAADMSTAKVSGSGAQTVVTAKVPEPMMKAMAGRLDESMPVGNEAPAWWSRPDRRTRRKALMGKTVAMIGGAMYCAIPLPESGRMSAAACGHHACRRRFLLCQSADGARHDRDHAPRRPQSPGAYRGRIQSRADAQQDLPQGRHRPRQYRAQRGAGRHPAQDRRQAYRRFHRAVS
jgi:NADPH:quinone reductase and related Zn-dependent oxidoreductases